VAYPLAVVVRMKDVAETVHLPLFFIPTLSEDGEIVVSPGEPLCHAFDLVWGPWPFVIVLGILGCPVLGHHLVQVGPVLDGKVSDDQPGCFDRSHRRSSCGRVIGSPGQRHRMNPTPDTQSLST
jgi:hypothetical protein